MPVNARMSPNDNRLYNPARDVAHCFGGVAEEVAKRVEDGRWQVLAQLAKDKGITDEDLGRAVQAALLFIAGQLDGGPKEGMGACLARCGWFDVPEFARVIVMAHWGSVMLGYHFAGVREATMGGVGPVDTYQYLRQAAQVFGQNMRMSRWRRGWYRVRRRVRKAWAALWADDRYNLEAS